MAQHNQQAPPTSNKKEEDEDVDTERSLLKCLKATRWVLVALVMAVTVAATARALVVAFRPIDLSVMVACGAVGLHGHTAADLGLNFTLRLCNPSGRDGLRYHNVTFELFGNSTKTSPGDSIVQFLLPDDTWVGTQLLVDVSLNADGIELMPQIAARYNGTAGTVRLEGLVQRRITGLRYTTGYKVIYYCGPVTIGNAVAANANKGDVYCSVGYFGEATPPPQMCHVQRCPP